MSIIYIQIRENVVKIVEGYIYAQLGINILMISYNAMENKKKKLAYH